MNDSTPELREALNRFVCQQCNECCKKPGEVYLREGESESIAAFLYLEEFDFINDYCELQDRRKLILKKYADESCIFLSKEGCRIHAAKPGQCRDFPIKWRTPASFDYCEGLKKVLP